VRPVFRQVDRRLAQVATTSLQLRFKAIEERQRIGHRTGESGQYASARHRPNFDRSALHDRITHRHLTVPGHRNQRATANRDDSGCS